MAVYNNTQELAEERRKKQNQEDFTSAMQQLRFGNSGNSNNQSSFANNFNSGYEQAGGLNNSLGKVFGEKLAGLGSNSGNSFNIIPDSMFSNPSLDNLSFMGNSGNIDNLSFLNSGSSALSDVGNTAGSSGGFWSKFGGGGSSGGGTPWGLIGGLAKQGYNAISGKDDKDYSDVEESIIYPLQGAAVGSSFGPWGALGGALYGLGYSFKDDLGLDDNNFLTQLLFPIGMGDGGGLRIGGESILDLG